jgi:histidine triad (HIT) family protein
MRQIAGDPTSIRVLLQKKLKTKHAIILIMTKEFNHEPDNYPCPFCSLLKGHEDEFATQGDIVYQNEFATAKIAPKWWVNNPGHVLVVPNEHYENIYDIPEEIMGEVYKVAQKIAIAMRSTYNCDGTSTRQHNEPAGNQDVWHFHVHVFPRYEGDQLYQNHDNKKFVSWEEREPYAKKLKEYFSKNV